uniref:sugar transferase n=1 Tax=Geomonas oryzae TaxID=2364273 RepID=UPI00100B613E
MAKRLFDLFFALPALLVLMPIFVVIAFWIKLDSTGPVLFRQERVGLKGKIFQILKFRTMWVDAEGKGRQITVGKDPRITRSGEFLRKSKLDELPQLFNVILGEMSLVGPRPEVPRYVALYSKKQRERILSVPPGITDFASIEFRDESTILARANDPELAYIREVMPIKLALCERYVAQRTLWVDLLLILRTFKAIVA